jgi:hypothetical protein
LHTLEVPWLDAENQGLKFHLLQHDEPRRRQEEGSPGQVGPGKGRLSLWCAVDMHKMWLFCSCGTSRISRDFIDSGRDVMQVIKPSRLSMRITIDKLSQDKQSAEQVPPRSPLHLFLLSPSFPCSTPNSCTPDISKARIFCSEVLVITAKLLHENLTKCRLTVDLILWLRRHGLCGDLCRHGIRTGSETRK